MVLSLVFISPAVIADTCGTYYIDQDNDGYGTSQTAQSCGGPGYATVSGDRNDVNSNMFPGNIEGFSPVDAFYFTAMTMLTVGYGDVVPHTGAGKIAAVLFALVSVGIALYSINIIAMLAFRHRLEDAQWLSQKMRKR